MAREYECTECHQTKITPTTRGRRPKVCPSCRGATAYVLESEREPAGEDKQPRLPDVPPPDPSPDPPDKQPRLPARAAVERSPFNSTPETAPVPVPPGAGRVEAKLITDLAMMERAGSPVADTLKAMALNLAKLADAGGTVREQIAVMKELRACLDSMTKTAKTRGGDGDDAGNSATGPADGPFGAVRAELVNT